LTAFKAHAHVPPLHIWPEAQHWPLQPVVPLAQQTPLELIRPVAQQRPDAQCPLVHWMSLVQLPFPFGVQLTPLQ
jgi:hypothetical protein